MWIPVLLQSDSVKPVIFGGGKVACRKAMTLCRYGVQSTMICPSPPEDIAGLEPKPLWISGMYDETRLNGATMVIAATDDGELNRTICREAGIHGIPALNASDGAWGTLCFPNAASSGDVTVAVSTGGSSPTAGSQILSELMEAVDRNDWPEKINLLSELRRLLKVNEPDTALRQESMRTFAMMSLEELQRRRQEYED